MALILPVLLVAFGVALVAASWRQMARTSAAAADQGPAATPEHHTTITFAPPWGAGAGAAMSLAAPSSGFNRVETRQGETVPAVEGHAAPSHQLRSDLMPETAPRGVPSKQSSRGLALDLETEAAIVGALAGLVDESRGKYAQAVEDAALETVGRTDITNNSIGQVVGTGDPGPRPARAVPDAPSGSLPAPAASAAPPAAPASPPAATAHAAAPASAAQAPPAPSAPAPQPSTAHVPVPPAAAPPAPMPASASTSPSTPAPTTPPSAAEAPSPPAPTPEPPATPAAKAQDGPKGRQTPLWLAGKRHLVAWLPMNETTPLSDGAITGTLLAVALENLTSRVVGVESRHTNEFQNPPVVTVEMLQPRSHAPASSAAPAPKDASATAPPMRPTPVSVRPVDSPPVSAAMTKVGQQMQAAVAEAHGDRPTPKEVLKTSRDFIKAAQHKAGVKHGGAKVKAPTRVVTIITRQLDTRTEREIGEMSLAEREALAGEDNDLD